jgi:tRNA (guanine9-N1)-methyltransferase
MSSNPSEQPTVQEAHCETPQLSKKAQKKAAKAERYAAFKLERRAKEKEMRKEKKAIRAAKRAAGELDEAELEAEEKKKRPKTKSSFGGRVVIDLGFDDKMTDKVCPGRSVQTPHVRFLTATQEVKSLCSQLAYTYSANGGAGFPFSLLFSSLSGKTAEKLSATNDAAYRRWSNTEWWDQGYQKLWQQTTSTGNGQVSERSSSGSADCAEQSSVIYLTADSEYELEEIKPDEIYVIGGLCDHNRYKVSTATFRS